jgi:hypothetical protein
MGDETMKRFCLALTAGFLMLVLFSAGSAHASCTSAVADASASDLLETIRCLEKKIDALESGGGDGTFFSAIVAFENHSCPPGWMPYPQAPGRVVIGARPGPSGRGPKLGEIGDFPSTSGALELPWVALLYCQKL